MQMRKKIIYLYKLRKCQSIKRVVKYSFFLQYNQITDQIRIFSLSKRKKMFIEEYNPNKINETFYVNCSSWQLRF
jgi:hypothetical protein